MPYKPFDYTKEFKKLNLSYLKFSAGTYFFAVVSKKQIGFGLASNQDDNDHKKNI